MLGQVTVNGTPKKPRILRKNKDDVTPDELQQVSITRMSSLKFKNWFRGMFKLFFWISKIFYANSLSFSSSFCV